MVAFMILGLLIGFVIPLAVASAAAALLPPLVDVATKLNTATWFKNVVLTVLAFLLALAQVAVAGDGLISDETFVMLAVNMVIAILTHLGVWKPSGASAKVSALTSSVGF